MANQFKGLAASPGVAIGNAWLFLPQTPTVETKSISAEDVQREIEAFKAAQAKVEAHLQRLYKKVLAKQGENEAAIFESHIEMLHDEDFEQEIPALIKDQHYTATLAVKEYLDQAADTMRSLDDPYLKERAAEFEDLQNNLLLALNNLPFATLGTAPKDSIVFAKDLTPSETAQLDTDNVRGFVLAGGGLTSHVAILARNIGLPAIMGIADILENVKEGDKIAMDGKTGELLVNADEKDIKAFENKQAEEKKMEEEYKKLLDQPAMTTDSLRIKLFSNIGSPNDLHLIATNGSEGVGLFRSEFLFMESSTAPSEQQQYDAYKEVAVELSGKTAILRLADIGGDKPLPYLNFPHEENPFLGWRGVRIYDETRIVFDSQIRAAMRAGAYGDLWVMIPMVTNVSDVLFVRNEIKKQAVLLTQEGRRHNPNIKVGIMIETPAAALIAPQLAEVSDFFSIGTNDLTQYVLAVDRGNTYISHLYDSLHPAVLRCMKMAADAAHAAGIEIGVCGEMGGQLEATPLLVGMGFNELSISGRGVPAVKYRIRQLNAEKCREVLNRALTEANDGAEVRALLKQYFPNFY